MARCQVEIQDITNSPGIIAVKSKEARIFKEYFKFIHVIELDDYIGNINSIHENINKFKNITHFQLAYQTLINKIKTLERTFYEIYPITRTKRGLINIIGSGIKFITGNMDHDDAIEINNRIFELSSNNNVLIKAYNNQVALNQELITRFKNITDFINSQQQLIHTTINNQKNDIINLQCVNLIDHDIQTIREHLQEISDCIRLAKINIVSKNIMTNEEINFIRNRFDKQNVGIHSLEEIYDHLEIQAYYNKSKLIFVMNIPNFDEQIYNEYIIEPIPNQNNKTIELPFHKVLIGGGHTFFVITPCNFINKISFCNRKQLKNIENDYCFKNILYNKNATCNYITTDLTLEVKQLENNIIIIKNAYNLFVNSSCNFTRNFRN